MQSIPLKPPWWRRALAWYLRFERWLIRWFSGRAPTLKNALVPMLLVSALLFMRAPNTNYIFDEQEALLANPFVNGAEGLTFRDVIHRDFWGLPPTASIGSYRPIPNVIWWLTWRVSEHPFVHHLYNLVFHALNAALLASFAFAVTRRRLYGWLAGFTFLAAAVITEAVSGIVGIADVLGGLGALLALSTLRLPASLMGLSLFAAMTLGLFSKESALVCVPLLPAAALLTAPTLHPERPARWARAFIALVAAASAFVLYVELRKRWFPSPLPSELTVDPAAGAHWLSHLRHDFLVWFHQAPLPRDPLNNPLAEADFPHRLSGALRVFFRGLVQVLFPLRLSGDYSYPQEPIPETLFSWESVAGGIFMLGAPLVALGLLVTSWLRECRDKRRLLPEGPLSDALFTLHHGGRAARFDAPLVASPPRPSRRRRLAVGVLLAIPAASAIAYEVHRVRATEGPPSGLALIVLPIAALILLAGLGLLVDGWRGQRRPMDAAGAWPWRHTAPIVVALGLVWTVVSYFPHSNIPVVLPTVRAERFWYLPVVGTSLIIAAILSRLSERLRGKRWWRLDLSVLLIALFFAIQGVQAYRHAMDYRDDLSFWRATKNAVPMSAKAHLNYSVMVGARDDLDTRLAESEIAKQLAPEWAMAHVYTGDTLCRMHRPHDAWPHFARGFELGKNDRSLIALALQCLHKEGALLDYEDELRALAAEHPGSWLDYLAIDTLRHHEEYGGVDPKYRPRGYNQGPKE